MSYTGSYKIADHVIEITSLYGEVHRLCREYVSDDAAAMMKTMTLVDRLGSSVSLYRLQCNMETEAAKTAYLGMRDNTSAQNKQN